MRLLLHPQELCVVTVRDDTCEFDTTSVRTDFTMSYVVVVSGKDTLLHRTDIYFEKP